MSAYVVNPEHAGLLAAYAVRQDHGECGTAVISALAGLNSAESAMNIARALIGENIKSVAHRYPDDADGERPGPSLKDAEIIEAAALWTGHYLANGRAKSLTPGFVLCLCDSLEYQSNEHDEWKQSVAKEQLDEIRSAAWHRLLDYQAAPWSFEDNDPALDEMIWGHKINS